MRYSDPSGHKPCVDFVGGVCINTADEYLVMLGIHTTGMSGRAKWETVYGALFAGIKFNGNTTSTTEDQVLAYRRNVGPTSVIIKSHRILGKKEPNCATYINEITCETDNTNYWLTTVLHEMGHVFDNRFKSTVGKLASGYDSYVEWEDKGFKCNQEPCMEHGPGFGDLPNRVEDFADMFMNWIMEGVSYEKGSLSVDESKESQNGFAADDYGIARRNQINDLMLNYFLQGKTPY